MQIDIYVKKTNKTYKTEHGVPFQCVELIRRFFSTIKHVSFPNVVDAVDFYQNIHSFDNVDLRTLSYPYQQIPLKPGAILFWKRRKPDFPYGHCALVLESNENETITIQQNLNPPVRHYNTKELFAKINRPDSKFLGIKIFPKSLPKIICNIVQI